MGARKKLALEQFNRDNILTAARELFETKGVQETTMDDIDYTVDELKKIIEQLRSMSPLYEDFVKKQK